MTPFHRLPAISRRASTLVAASLAFISSVASAQTYTAKVLPYPSTTTGCVGSYAHLDDLGNVQGRCYFRQTKLSVLWFAFLSGGKANDVEKTVIWRPTGLPQILNINGKGFNAIGQALSGPPQDANYFPKGVYSYWNGLTRKTVLSVPNLSGAWTVMDRGAKAISRGGQAMLLTPSAKTTDLANIHAQLAVLRNGVGTLLPAIPPACQPQDPQRPLKMVYAVNDAGQVGTLAINHPATSRDQGPEVPTKHQPCLWDGQQWQVGPVLPDVPSDQYSWQSYDLEARSPLKLDISSHGELLVHLLIETAVTWKPGMPTWTEVDARARQYGADDQWIGGAIPSDLYKEKPALVWHQGNLVDLNTVAVGLPADQALISAVSANKKGQILAVAVPRTGPLSREKVKLVLLTPR